MTDAPGIAQLKIYNEAYRLGEPIVPDPVYDEMYKREKEKYPDDDFFKKVQPERIKNEVKLPYIMGSLSNHDKHTVGKWLKKYPCEGGYVASHKLDGVSFTLVYEDGEVVLGATRGEGDVGQNMTDKAKVFAPKIDYGGTVVVRGECLLNCVPESIGYHTRRNAVAGIMMRDDHEKLEYVMFKAFEILQADEMPEYVSEQMGFMAAIGFDVVSWVHIPNEYIDKIPMILENMVTKFQNDENRPYDIDGAVVCTDDYVHENSSYPKGKIAFKREEEIYTSPCTKVLWDVSRLGRQIPVVCYEPIEIGGATFERATAHHASVIALYGIKPGEVVKICRAKEVIPMVVTDEMAQNPDYSLIPTNCVSCGTELQWDSNKVHLICNNNDSCSTKMLKKITHFFISLGLKEFTLSSFKSLGLDTVEKACTITKEEIVQVDGWGETSAQQFVNGIKACLNPTMTQFITALGIDSIGEKMASHIAPLAKGDMKNIPDISSLSIRGLPLVGDKRGSQIVTGLLESRSFIHKCAKFITIQAEEEAVSDKLAGKKFCLTGKMSKPRSEIQDIIAANGGINASGISKPSTSSYKKDFEQFLVTNEESTSSKYNKALAYGVPIITEEQLMEMINS